MPIYLSWLHLALKVQSSSLDMVYRIISLLYVYVLEPCIINLLSLDAHRVCFVVALCSPNMVIDGICISLNIGYILLLNKFDLIVQQSEVNLIIFFSFPNYLVTRCCCFFFPVSLYFPRSLGILYDWAPQYLSHNALSASVGQVVFGSVVPRGWAKGTYWYPAFFYSAGFLAQQTLSRPKHLRL